MARHRKEHTGGGKEKKRAGIPKKKWKIKRRAESRKRN